MTQTREVFADPASEENIQRVAQRIRERNIEVVVVDDGDQARKVVLERLPEGAEVHSAKSQTLKDAGIFDTIHDESRYDALRPRYLKMDPEDSSGSSAGGSGRCFHASAFPLTREEQQLLCGFASTFGQTRSGTGDAHASGQHLPLFRAFFYSLVCCLQARLRTFPGNDILGTRGDTLSCWIKVGGQKRGVQVALHRPDTARALVPTLRERLRDERAASMTPLGQFRGACRDFVQGAARACNGAFEVCYQHPWSTKSHALAVAFLPAFVGKLLGDDGVAHRRDLVSQSAMQALAVGRQPALAGRLAPPADLVATALLPAGSTSAAFPGPTPLVVVLRIGGAPLPLHAALQVTNSSRIGTKLSTQRLEPGFRFPRHNGDAGRSQVQADGVRAHHVFGLVVGRAIEHQLHEVTISLSVGALCAWAAGRAAHQAGILDLVR